MPTDPVIARQLKELPKAPGIYMFKDGAGRVMYIGKAKDLSKRVRSYFDKKRVAAEGRIKVTAMIKHIRRIETITVKNEAEALMLEGRLLKEYKPKYNTDFVDDKRFILIRLDNSAKLPKFSMCRVRNDARSSYYGPFVHGAAAKKIYYALRERYGVVLSDTKPKELSDGSFQLYDDVRSEIFCSSNSAKDSSGEDSQNFSNIVTADEYRVRVSKACAFLEGQVRQVREELAQKMQEASGAQRYEQAAKLRDLLEAIEFAKNPQKKFLQDPMLNVLDPQRAMSALQEALQMDELPDSIECFDISHISGSFVVASLVHFANGKPDKRKYKRFRIREFVGNDDFQSMREVVGRHYGRLVAEDKPLPKLIVIDGGAGQVSSAAASLIEVGVPLNLPIGNPQEESQKVNAPQVRSFAGMSSAVTHPMLLGLAKREETFIFSDGRPPLTLERDHIALRLLQRVRDEAHRFANSYNADLRSKAIKSSILDEVPGVGPKKREAILSAFRSIDALRKASAETIAAKVPGVGLKQAAEIVKVLQR